MGFVSGALLLIRHGVRANLDAGRRTGDELVSDTPTSCSSNLFTAFVDQPRRQLGLGDRCQGSELSRGHR